jgi:hypothetical protein
MSNNPKDSYNPYWKMEYIELKGWDNMYDGEKFLCTVHIRSSVEGMGAKKLMEELKVMKAKAGVEGMGTKELMDKLKEMKAKATED